MKGNAQTFFAERRSVLRLSGRRGAASIVKAKDRKQKGRGEGAS